ncbi:hypothetical protein SynPROSU1_01532 [Synechococcus sp. PROS-U-1]|nr:hypothetical protein SynPROSU1_01532 [Synechococcus sp. PROS-U-1]
MLFELLVKRKRQNENLVFLKTYGSGAGMTASVDTSSY